MGMRERRGSAWGAQSCVFFSTDFHAILQMPGANKDVMITAKCSMKQCTWHFNILTPYNIKFKNKISFRQKQGSYNRNFLMFSIGHHTMTLPGRCLGQPNHSLTEKVSSWLMIFLSSGIFICVQSPASISTLALAQQCHCDFAEPFSTLEPFILRCIYRQTTITRSFIDLRETTAGKRQGEGGKQTSWKSEVK